MADDGNSIDGCALKTVVSMIKDMEFQVQQALVKIYSFDKNISFQGFAVPERISINI